MAAVSNNFICIGALSSFFFNLFTFFRPSLANKKVHWSSDFNHVRAERTENSSQGFQTAFN